MDDARPPYARWKVSGVARTWAGDVGRWRAASCAARRPGSGRKRLGDGPL